MRIGSHGSVNEQASPVDVHDAIEVLHVRLGYGYIDAVVDADWGQEGDIILEYYSRTGHSGRDGGWFTPAALIA